MGKKSFKKGRRGGAAGSGQRGGGGAVSDPMEVDPPPAVEARIERNALARQKVVLPSTVQKIKVPSFGEYIDATRAENPEEAIRSLKIPRLRGIVSTNDNPRICAHCSAAFPEGFRYEVATLHMTCGAMICNDCFRGHTQVCTSNRDLILLNVKTGAPWALYHYALASWKGKDGHMFLPMLQLAADAGHPEACRLISIGKGTKGETSENSYFKYFYDMPRDISSAAEHAERALVLGPDIYRRQSSVVIQLFLSSLASDGRFKEARVLAGRMVGFEDRHGHAQEVLGAIDSASFGPFYDQLATIGQMSQVDSAPSSVPSLYFLDQHNMSPEELRLADYESGDGVLHMTFTALKFLSQQFSVSSCPLIGGLGGLVSSIHHLMGQPVNRGLYRSIPSIMRDIAGVLSEVDPSAPEALLNSEHFLLLMLTSVATCARTDPRDIQVGELDRNFCAITDAITKNPNLPGYLRALAFIIQADNFCELPYNDETLFSSNCPREVVIRRKSFVLCDYANVNEKCPLKALSARLVEGSARRLAYLQGPSRHGALERITSFRFTHGDGSADSEELIEDMRSSYSSTVGGSGCDQCGKTVSKMLPTLLKCRRCCQAHFCSNECASQAWDSWHSQSCKKIGVFSVGDLVRVKGISYEEGNGRIRSGANAVITGKTENGQWAVKALDPFDDGTYDTLCSKNLYHLRTLE